MSTNTKRMISSKMTNVTAKTWMIGCLLMEAVMTIITWAAIPLVFKIWSVLCLLIEGFLVVREFALNPVKQRVAAGIYA